MFCTESSHRVIYEHNKDNNVSSITEIVNGTTKTYSYTYDDDKRLISENADGITVTYTYDDLGRLTQKQTLNGETVIKTDSYTFTASTVGTNGTSSQVASYNGLSYTYDDNGNILSVSDGTNTTSYVYDSANQLVRENNQALGFTRVWTYDNAGNILSRSEYAYTTADDLSSLTATDAVTYQYTSAKWGDMLRYYGDSYLLYDASGNLTSDGKFTYTWEHGRELVCVTAPSGAQVLATYGADGLRTGRVVKYSSGAVKAAYTYVYDGGKLSRMTYGNYVVDITYDAAGTPLTMIVNGQTTYYYVTNLQGDVIALKDATGTEVITYSYDAWGNVVSRTGTYATLNPLLYRGYVFDWEIHLYYLQSRYYNPEWGRFINGDALATTGQGFIGNNMFAYCGNNPVIFTDPTGTRFRLVGAGLQIELDFGCYTIGLEIIIYWDVDECSNGGVTVAIYTYDGMSLSLTDPTMGSLLVAITDNLHLISGGSDAGMEKLINIIKNGFSDSVSGVFVFGDDTFNSVRSYEGPFKSFNGNIAHVKGGFAYSNNAMAVAVGATTTKKASFGISVTDYKLRASFNLGEKANNVGVTWRQPFCKDNLTIAVAR